ncbi:MAG: Fic family protein [Archangium sp.]|nr:Fic family protein [Archangium sp.]
MSLPDADRSLFPPAGTQHPFTWTDASVRLTQLARRVERAWAHPLPGVTLKSLQSWFRTQHVYDSNAIEGSALTLSETQVVIGDGLTVGGRPLRDLLAAKNLADALDWVHLVARRDEPLSERLIREVHQLVTRGEDDVLPGSYRREGNMVSGARHRTPNHAHVGDLMAKLGAFLSSDMDPDPLISSAIAHAWLVGVHPFRDGNGRTARLLSNLVLLRRTYPISLLGLESRPRYYDALDHAHCTGDLSPFIELSAECVEATLAEYERLNGAIEVRERSVHYFAERLRTPDSKGALQAWRDALTHLTAELSDWAERTNQQAGSQRVRVSRSPEHGKELNAEPGSIEVEVDSAPHFSRQFFSVGRQGSFVLSLGLAEVSELEPAGSRLRLRTTGASPPLECTYAEAANAIMDAVLREALGDAPRTP